MVIRAFLREISLDPAEVSILITAYDRARDKLGLANKDDAICRALASHVINVWGAGSAAADQIATNAIALLVADRKMAS